MCSMCVRVCPLSERLLISELLAIKDISDLLLHCDSHLPLSDPETRLIRLLLQTDWFGIYFSNVGQQVWQVASRHSQLPDWNILKMKQILLFPTYHQSGRFYLIACDNYILYISPSAMHTKNLMLVCSSVRGNSYKYRINALQHSLGMQIVR